jgi:hypothetical protein
MRPIALADKGKCVDRSIQGNENGGIAKSAFLVAVSARFMDLSDALDRAIAAHAKWKYRLMEAIDTAKSQWRAADVRTDHACEFGKWLATLPLSQRLSEHSKTVRALHAEFHGLAADVLELALAGRKEEATAAISLSSRFATVSSKLTMAVLAWKEDQGACA